MTTQPSTFLILGGARSGKSRHAQRIAQADGGERVFVATAQAFDDEMRDRIARHRADRDSSWHTVEAPLALVDAIRSEDAPGRVLLVDCLTLWLSNLLLAGHDVAAESDALVAAVPRLCARLILVSNEVGLSVVPDNALARRFRDAAGMLNQRLAQICDSTEFIVAGHPIRLNRAE
ncbi:bifunctional adenosylcobinamide kinase/adenosylcobinamide-phosphate guanylyltransferase [Stakelama sp. CBK3Z-3]|uniref:Bifunctional adenosylcobalamin biosynthesis protein n=1 Tax=Stakelama flava TaxID=2860338 RepID=A0ABS6XHB4_9SPHN|nr:bifunctional adenosylcobinamide kinase/adenosylcobinamide-phosphate guanylyltransferase [Stakelama flava]MBW4329602.1 bifunctional adenosylcobinamide kinase/adenosylcobinamide-phosphate guanylyltransferase [Stakelama flava]